MIRASTRMFGVLGHPVGHSLSPAMHNAALRELGLDGVYLAFDVPPHRLAAAVSGLAALNVGGVNCTIPHKQAVIPLLAGLSDDARLIGAVNTLELRDGEWFGHNTDAPGFLSALRAEGVEPADKSIVVLGAGGAARAVAVALIRCGAAVTLANRSLGRAEQLAAEMRERMDTTSISAVSMASPDLVKSLAAADILVNASSVGMSPKVEEMPDVPVDLLRPGLFVYDLIYNPLETRLLREARARGATGAHGAGMLAHQGALALEIWTGRAAPAELMSHVIVAALDPEAS